MTTETRKRIRAYKRMLPELRERVIAVALLLAMSVSMLGTASYAWLTISRRPEVTGANTTIAANGNLEIALATGEREPDESKVGDSSAAEGQSVTAANVTWGNLVNLSDASYGLDHLTLRPAQLNEDALLTSPLFGAVYTADGRVEKLTSSFSYTSWVPPSEDGLTPGHFGISDNLGVRAISSTKTEVLGYLGTLNSMWETASTGNALAINKFRDITDKDAWMKALANMMGIHMTAKLNGEDEYKNAAVSADDLGFLIDMYDAFIEAYEAEAAAIADMLNAQLYAAYGRAGTYNTYSKESVLALTSFASKTTEQYNAGDYINTITDGTGNQKIIKAKNMKVFIADYNMLVADVAELRRIDQTGDRRWTASGLYKVINRLVNIDQCEIKFQGENQSKTVQKFLNEMADNPFSALSYRDKNCDATITNGVLYNFDQRTGSDIFVGGENKNDRLPVTAKMYVSTMNLGEQVATVYANIQTSAKAPSEFAQDLTYGKTLNTGADSSGGEVIAQDTYGLAIDLWVRTNADGSYLTLEGNVLTEEHEEPAKGRDSNGNEVDLYTLSRTNKELDETGAETGNTYTETYDLYQIETEQEDGTKTVTWYRADTFSPFALEEGETPTQKMDTIVTVIGYEGENRVWDRSEGGQNAMISADATTQGSGSCYIYYADTPEDQARSMELLKAMHVAFVDSSGTKLAEASMDTSRSYEDSGRVIVPLVLDAESIQIGEEENSIRAIMPLTRNQEERITALVYLDGTALNNDNVLSAADIQGQLNIQFGSSSAMEPIRNEKLETAERAVSATVSRSEFKYDVDPDLTTTVTVNVTGDEPTTVNAFFLRKINESQGSREAVMTFTKDASGAWISDYTFTAPGVYVLRTVELDGQEYVLKETPEVTVEGFTIEALTCKQAEGSNKINIKTAESSRTVDLTLKFASDDVAKMPSTVQGRFLRTDGTAVNINFTYNATTGLWNGRATFIASGDYTLQYLVLNGEYTELPANLQQTAVVYLGMRVAVYTDGNTGGFKFLPSEMEDNEKLLPMSVKIVDNAGKEMLGLQGARLTYVPNVPSAKKMETDLTWNARTGFYTGELKTLESGGPGTWIFKNVVVDGEEITIATTAPTFTMYAAEPPSFVGIPNPVAYSFSPDGNAFMEAELKHSSTSTVVAMIAGSDGVAREVQGSLYATNDDTNVSTWRFTIPDNASQNQNGNWTMQEIKVWNFYQSDGTYVSAELIGGEGSDKLLLKPGGHRDEPMVFDVADHTMKVVEKFTLRFAENPGNTSKTGSNAFTGAFLDTHTFSGVNFVLCDFEDKPLQNVSGISLVYGYDGKTSENGGYTSANVTAVGESFTLGFAANATGTNYVQSGSGQTLQYAGTYYPVRFEFMVSGKSYKYGGDSNLALPNGIPSFTVKSDVPTVKITAITPTGSNPAKITYTTEAIDTCEGGGTRPTFKATGNETSAIDTAANKATVYAVATADNDDQAHGSFTRPTLTVTVAGVTSDSAVSFTLPGGSADAITFSRTGNGTIKNTLGKVDQIKSWTSNLIYTHTLDAYYGHGDQTISTMTLIKNDVTYTVHLDKSVIVSNPSSTNQ